MLLRPRSSLYQSLGRTYRGVCAGRQRNLSAKPNGLYYEGSPKEEGSQRVVPALYTKESGSGGLGHSLVPCLVNSDIVINI